MDFVKYQIYTTSYDNYPFLIHHHCFPKVVFIPSALARDNSVLLITLFLLLWFSYDLVLHFNL